MMRTDFSTSAFSGTAVQRDHDDHVQEQRHKQGNQKHNTPCYLKSFSVIVAISISVVIAVSFIIRAKRLGRETEREENRTGGSSGLRRVVGVSRRHHRCLGHRHVAQEIDGRGPRKSVGVGRVLHHDRLVPIRFRVPDDQRREGHVASGLREVAALALLRCVGHVCFRVTRLVGPLEGFAAEADLVEGREVDAGKVVEGDFGSVCEGEWGGALVGGIDGEDVG